jgi:hypothetical protein
VRWKQLQWRKYDPISILEVGSLSGCGLWCRFNSIARWQFSLLQEKGGKWPDTCMYCMLVCKHFLDINHKVIRMLLVKYVVMPRKIKYGWNIRRTGGRGLTQD